MKGYHLRMNPLPTLPDDTDSGRVVTPLSYCIHISDLPVMRHRFDSMSEYIKIDIIELDVWHSEESPYADDITRYAIDFKCVRIIPPEEYSDVFKIDSRGYVTQITYGGTCRESIVKQDFDDRGNLIYYDVDGEWYKSTFDDKNQLIRRDFYTGSYHTYDYDDNGKIIDAYNSRNPRQPWKNNR